MATLTLSIIGNGYDTHITYEASKGIIRLHYFWTNLQSPLGGTNLRLYNKSGLSDTYVIIEGNLISKTPGSSYKNLKKMTYEQVMDHFGLNY